MDKKLIIEELRFVRDSLNECIPHMEEIISPKKSTVFWRLIFPAGPFMQQKSNAKMVSGMLIQADSRIKEMVEVLEERDHPFAMNINRLLELNLIDLADRLVELPERAQYMIQQIVNISSRVEDLIQEIVNNEKT